MANVFASPLRYTQGPNATEILGAEMIGLGLEGPVCVVASRSARAALESVWKSIFQRAGIAHAVHPFGGECSRIEIAAAVAAARQNNAKVMVAAGGGKAIDTGRAAAKELGIPIVSCPTIASTDAPCSASSVIYTSDGAVESSQFYEHNPSLVLVDSTVIARAPLRLLVAGMGDALSTWFEARACIRSGARNMRGGQATRAAAAIAELCWQTLQADATQAVSAMHAMHAAYEAGNHTMEPPAALERIIEANTLLSGLGFESAGLAAAHAIHNGLTIAAETHHCYHGEKVAYGTLVQLVLEQAPDYEIKQVVNFSQSVGLPVTLKQLGFENLPASLLQQIAERTVIAAESIHNEPFPVNAQMVQQAIMEADRIGRNSE